MENSLQQLIENYAHDMNGMPELGIKLGLKVFARELLSLVQKYVPQEREYWGDGTDDETELARSDGQQTGFNDCRTQILSSLDELLTSTE